MIRQRRALPGSVFVPADMAGDLPLRRLRPTRRYYSQCLSVTYCEKRCEILLSRPGLVAVLEAAARCQDSAGPGGGHRQGIRRSTAGRWWRLAWQSVLAAGMRGWPHSATPWPVIVGAAGRLVRRRRHCSFEAESIATRASRALSSPGARASGA